MFRLPGLSAKKISKLIPNICRLALLVYFIAMFWLYFTQPWPSIALEMPWIIYLIVLYGLAEYLYVFFGRKNIDLTYAWPLLVAVYIISLVAILAGGQEVFPALNRIEHFVSFILITYVVWIFFLKYLPHAVWSKHPYYTALLVLAITSMAGVWNEHFEFFSDMIFNTRLVGPVYDTSLDLLTNTMGSLALLAFELFTIPAKAENKKFLR